MCNGHARVIKRSPVVEIAVFGADSGVFALRVGLAATQNWVTSPHLPQTIKLSHYQTIQLAHHRKLERLIFLHQIALQVLECRARKIRVSFDGLARVAYPPYAGQELCGKHAEWNIWSIN